MRLDEQVPIEPQPERVCVSPVCVVLQEYLSGGKQDLNPAILPQPYTAFLSP